MTFIYLDNHATTRCDPRVVEAMLPYFSEDYANPGSVTHEMGREAEAIVESARRTIADCLGCAPAELVFTSGSTESNFMAIDGLAGRQSSGHIITVACEHPSVLTAVRRLQRRNYGAALLPVLPAGDPHAGVLEVSLLASQLREDTFLVSCMWANNEIGNVQPIQDIGAICRQRGIALHCDATQALGKWPIRLRELPVDLMSFSAHKIHGPKGVGLLYIRGGRDPVRLAPPVPGGGQERGRRGGTLNVPGIVGMARAIELATAEMHETTNKMRSLRDRLYLRLRHFLPDLCLNGPELTSNTRLVNNLNVQFPGVDGHTLMVTTPEVCISSGSACTATSTDPSHVLQAIGLDPDAVRSSIRFGLSRFTTVEEIDRAADLLGASWARLRRLTH